MVGEKIKNYLDCNGIKYSFVADAIGVNANAFSSMLKGTRKIAVEEFISICNTLNVETNLFLAS